MIFIFLSFFQLAHSEKCMAISLEGGGSHGAYEIGALMQLAESLPKSELEYDVVAGISIGSFNAGGFAQFSKYETKEGAEFMYKIWNSTITRNSDMYQEWPHGLAYSVAFDPSIYDPSPSRYITYKYYTGPLKKKIIVGMVNLNTGEFTNYNETIGNAEMINAISCSSSPPFFFPPEYFNFEWYVDGGCMINLDAFSAVERCLEVTKKQKEITLDMINDMYVDPLSPDTKFNTIDVLSRARQIRKFDKKKWYDYNVAISYPDINIRYSIWPSKQMPGFIVPLDFSHNSLAHELELGKNDTINVLNSKVDARQKIKELYENPLIFYL